MADRHDQSANDDGFDLSSKDGKLVMSIMEANLPNFSVHGWSQIAAKNGLSVATAKQRFGYIKRRYNEATEGVVHPAPVVLKRKRGSKVANADDGKESNEENTPPSPAPKSRRQSSRRARASNAESAAVDNNSSAQYVGDEEAGEEVAEEVAEADNENQDVLPGNARKALPRPSRHARASKGQPAAVVNNPSADSSSGVEHDSGVEADEEMKAAARTLLAMRNSGEN
ncbi:uncharacterized protein PG998_008149 [Apiospora kogelbergensis]|uniref:uncharacterized protein n=1 Tax=Apiospora kogelbergensis TaxID=1337665 RepID=UPI00312E3934